MKLANERAWLEATIETDSLVAVNLINNEADGNHPEKTLIQDCKNLKEAQLLEIKHVHCEGNKCADYMAKLGKVQGEQYMKVLVPPNELVQLLKADMQGVAYPRGD
ncbi:hypothetical protein LguiB_028632 [Lonicera macranthoides]